MKQTDHQNLWQNQQGAIFVMFALMANVIVLAVALSMDLGRGYMAGSAIAGASDAAAVASAVDGGDEQKAREYFIANLPTGTLGITYNYDTDVTHTVDAEGVSVATSGFQVPAIFSKGNTTGSAAVNTGGEVKVGLAASITPPADIIFIHDASGSMGWQISGMLVTNYTPITIVGPERVPKWKALEAATLGFMKVLDESQDPDNADGFPRFRVATKSYDDNLRTNAPFENNLQGWLSYYPAAISPGGYTNPGAALQAAKAELLASSQDGRRKVVILLTDGRFNRNPSGDWDWPADYTGAKGNSAPHQAAATLCSEIKLIADAEMWTIRFGDSANGGLNGDTMAYCASDPEKNIFAADGESLSNAFLEAAQSIANLRILK